MQLTLSAEVGRIATSILDLDRLMERVTELVLESYAHVYLVDYVAVLLADQFGEWLQIVASSGARPAGAQLRVATAGGGLEARALAGGRVCLSERERTIQVVVPLRIGDRPLGVLELLCLRQVELEESDMDVLQSLGDQISVAIENARLYAAEREAVERLSQLDHVRLASLGVGSRELATELNTIIGFSRLLIKGADGPLNDLQRTDLSAVHKSGYRLLGLIDNVITLSELEGDSSEIARETIPLTGLLNEVVGIARTRLPDVALNLASESDVVTVRGDVGLLRKAFLVLLLVAAERLPQNQVTVRALVPDQGAPHVLVHIGNGDLGLREAMIRDALSHGAASTDSEETTDEMSVGLTLARRIIHLHQGRLWLQFDLEQGLDSVTLLQVDP